MIESLLKTTKTEREIARVLLENEFTKALVPWARAHAPDVMEATVSSPNSPHPSSAGLPNVTARFTRSELGSIEVLYSGWDSGPGLAALAMRLRAKLLEQQELAKDRRDGVNREYQRLTRDHDVSAALRQLENETPES